VKNYARRNSKSATPSKRAPTETRLMPRKLPRPFPMMKVKTIMILSSERSRENRELERKKPADKLIVGGGWNTSPLINQHTYV